MRWLAAFLMVVGVSLAGSDGAFFPYLNFVGVAFAIGGGALAMLCLPLEDA